jgi:hypothetical protein
MRCAVDGYDAPRAPLVDGGMTEGTAPVPVFICFMTYNAARIPAIIKIVLVFIVSPL